MAITLVFRGGFFQLLPGSGPARRVEVHFRLTDRVSVSSGREEIGRLLSLGSRIDFECRGRLETGYMPVRPVSHRLPIDYQGFRKTISFDAGRVSGAGPGMPASILRKLIALKQEGDRGKMRSAFTRLTGIDGHDEESTDLLMDELFADLVPERVRRWLPAYHLRVELPGRGVRMIVNGRRHASVRVPDGVRIELRPAADSVLPHFPADNPHVLEQPPTG